MTDRYRWQWRQLLSSMADELALAKVNYGVDLHPRRHRDLIDRDKGRVEVLTKLLAEARVLSREGRERP